MSRIAAVALMQLGFPVYTAVAESGAMDTMVRVALKTSLVKAVIGGRDISVTDRISGEVLKTAERVTLSVDEAGLTVDGHSTNRQSLRLHSTGGEIRFEDRVYPGSIEVFSREGERMLLVAEVPMEIYIQGVVVSEMPAGWLMDALKAQAVVARTYAVREKIRRRGKLFHLESGVIDQVYRGSKDVDRRVVRAVRATRGEVLTYRRAPIEAPYHSCCAVGTDSSAATWGSAQPYLQGTTCGFDGDCPRFSWQVSIPAGELARLFKLDGESLKLAVAERTGRGRVTRLELRDGNGVHHVKTTKLRRKVGFDRLPGPAFEVGREGDRLVFTGRGAGHGVGMCQWGARGMALAGRGYRQILSHYYPGTKLRRIY